MLGKHMLHGESRQATLSALALIVLHSPVVKAGGKSKMAKMSLYNALTGPISKSETQLQTGLQVYHI